MVPIIRISIVEKDLGCRKVVNKLAPIAGTRPIYLRRVPLEDPVPIHLFAAGRGFPVGKLLGMVPNLVHVMARPPAQHFQGEFG
jgi:hypothetical protein